MYSHWDLIRAFELWTSPSSPLVTDIVKELYGSSMNDQTDQHTDTPVTIPGTGQAWIQCTIVQHVLISLEILFVTNHGNTVLIFAAKCRVKQRRKLEINPRSVKKVINGIILSLQPSYPSLVQSQSRQFGI